MFQRNTTQRRVILEELKKVKSHPTAQQLHKIVRKKVPDISLATVYRNLKRLSEQELINELEVAGSDKRFDGDTSDHLHVRCASCGCVADLKLASNQVTSDQANNPVKTISDWKVIGSHIEYRGICPGCYKQKST